MLIYNDCAQLISNLIDVYIDKEKQNLTYMIVFVFYLKYVFVSFWVPQIITEQVQVFSFYFDLFQ